MNLTVIQKVFHLISFPAHATGSWMPASPQTSPFRDGRGMESFTERMREDRVRIPVVSWTTHAISRWVMWQNPRISS